MSDKAAMGEVRLDNIVSPNAAEPRVMTLSAPTRLGVFMLCLALAAWSGLAYLSTPFSQPGGTSANVFSADRAMTHVAALTTAPRPIGSVAHTNSRAYIIAELARLGLRPQVQQAVSAFRFPGSEGFGAAKVQNVIARIEGTQSQGALLLNAHYDSGNTGPGAGDCGACVAALLETARVLQTGPKPRHDVIFVFSDGEEVGDHGAHAFATQHPWMKDVALALNYEAMGTKGPGTLYVTSDKNAALVQALASNMPRGFGNSVITTLFNAIPQMRNACDLQDYLDYGVAGLGFVLHGQTQNYHTRLDDAAHLSRDSVQSFGDSALGMARAYDQLGPKGIQSTSDAVFFPLAPFGTLVFPTNWALPLALMGLFLTAIIVGIGIRDKRLALQHVVGGGVTGLLVTPLLVAIVAAAIWAGLRAVNPNLQVFLIGGYATAWHVAGLSALAIGVTAWMFASLRQWFGSADLLAGIILMLSAIGVFFAVLLPGMFYVVTIPALFALPALVSLVFNQRGVLWSLSVLLPAMAITALVALLIVPSGMLLAFVIRLEAMTGFPLLALPTALTALSAGFIIALIGSYVPEAKEADLKKLALAACVISAAAFGFGAARSGFSADNPRPESVRYELNANTKSAKWLTNDPILGDWSGQFFPPISPRLADGATTPGGPPTFSTSAPLYDIPAPTVDLVEPSVTEGDRKMRLLITSPRRAPLIEVSIAADSAISSASIGGQALDLTDYAPATGGKLIFFASALAAEGFVVELTLKKAAKVQVKLADMSDGLPGPAKTRPSTTMPSPGATLDGTISRSEFDL